MSRRLNESNQASPEARHMEKIATNTFDFALIRRGGLTYVDKTALIHPIADGSMGNQFFLARPRRFGKSLLCSTLQCLFEGRRELFEGLAISSMPWDWSKRYPVIRLDMTTCSGATLEEVKVAITAKMRRESERLGVPLRDESGPREALAAFIEDVAATGSDGQCVLLIDEYDKPLTRWVGTEDVLPYQEFLKSFYSVVKETESRQRFCLMTGVSKFSKVSIFSDLNNLTDLTLSPFATTLLGYTHDEVRQNFPQRLEALGRALGTDVDGAFSRLVDMYDGYRFDEALVPVFNPVSLGNALSTLRLSSYWFETGTPGWLMSYAKKAPIDVDGLEVSGQMLGTFEPASPSMPAVLLQTGYLTIKGVSGEDVGKLYDLGFPNREVQAGFSTWLARAYTGVGDAEVSGWATACRRAVAGGDAEGFVDALRSFFASIGYDLTDRLSEQAYQCVCVAILRFIGIYLQAEVRTSRGRIDTVLRAPGNVFVVEMKVASGEQASDQVAQTALEQIRSKGYADPYRAGSEQVTLLGLTFDCLTHNIGAWVAEGL